MAMAYGRWSSSGQQRKGAIDSIRSNRRERPTAFVANQTGAKACHGPHNSVAQEGRLLVMYYRTVPSYSSNKTRHDTTLLANSRWSYRFGGDGCVGLSRSMMGIGRVRQYRLRTAGPQHAARNGHNRNETWESNIDGTKTGVGSERALPSGENSRHTIGDECSRCIQPPRPPRHIACNIYNAASRCSQPPRTTHSLEPANDSAVGY